MKKLNPAHIDALLPAINQAPYFRLLSMSIKEIGMGFCVVEVEIENKHYHPFGGVHGGLYCSAIDTAAFWSAYAEVDESAGLLTIDVNVNILAPVFEDKLIINGRCIKAGKTICMTEAEASTPDGKIIAQGVSKLLRSPNLPGIPEALASLSGPSLPPKFLENV